MVSKTLLVFSLVASVILLAAEAKSLSKRQIGGIVGGFSPISVDDEEVKKIALFAAQSLSSTLNSGKPLSVVKVVKAQSQVVAGQNYQLELVMGTGTDGSTISCEVTVFDQSWTNTREVTKSACKPEPVKANKGKRSITEEAQPVLDVKTEEVKPIVVHHPIVGGFQPADVNSEEVKAMAAFATESLSSALNSGKPMALVEITEAKRQFVGGVNYNLGLVMKGENGRVTCSVSMHEHKHDNIRKINEFACKPEPAFVSAPAAPVKRSANEAKEPPRKVGGYQEVSIDDEQVKEMALFAATAVSSETNAGPLKLHKIVKAEKQVVAGANYKLTIEFASVDETHQLCEVVIFDQSWTNTRKLSESKCGPKKV